MAWNILADQNIPFVREAFSHLGRIRTLAGHAITPEALEDAAILLVRSVTQVDARLVRESCLRFVGSATIGTDHIDRAALQAHQITFAHSPGSGAEAINEYVIAALMFLMSENKLRSKTPALGVVGCGNIGTRVAQSAQALGLRILCSDPPLEAAGGAQWPLVPLHTVLRHADIITLHVPLTHTGPHQTGHMIGRNALRQMKPSAWLINTSRGAVVESRALRQALLGGSIAGAILDVWENEPAPSLSLLRAVRLATPHIAGHSFDGKLLGTVKLYRAVTHHFGIEPTWDHWALAHPAAPLCLVPPRGHRGQAAWLDRLTRQMYDLRADDARMRTLLDLPPDAVGSHFRQLRSTYPPRRAFRWYQIPTEAVPAPWHGAVRHGLGVRLVS